MEKVDSECRFFHFFITNDSKYVCKKRMVTVDSKCPPHLMLIDIQYKHKEISAYLLKLKMQLQEIKNEYISENHRKLQGRGGRRLFDSYRKIYATYKEVYKASL